MATVAKATRRSTSEAIKLEAFHGRPALLCVCLSVPEVGRLSALAYGIECSQRKEHHATIRDLQALKERWLSTQELSGGPYWLSAIDRNWQFSLLHVAATL